MHYGVIMAGGSGTRLWPLSREALPKQLLPIVRGQSLLRLSFDRLRAFLPVDRIYVCTAEQHRDVVLRDLPELKPENLIGEPMGRDTSNAVGLSAAVLAKRDPDAVFAIVTADHVIEPVDVFAESMRTGFDVARRRPESLVTFGITPTHGHTGLGYVERGQPLAGHDKTFAVGAFKEKPDQPTADRYAEDGEHYWNSGMFVWRAATVMSNLREFLPHSADGLTRIADAWGTPRQREVLGEIYPTLKKISVDFAILEPAGKLGRVVVVEMPVSWLDVGSWPQLSETLETDEHGNATQCDHFAILDSGDNIVVNTDRGHVVSLIGVSDMVVVHTPDATLVCPKSEAQRVKEMVAAVRARFGDRYL